MRTGLHASFDMDSKKLTYLESEVPSPPEGGLVARVTVAGVCGSDAHRLVGDVQDSTGPVSFGHEAVGVVEELSETTLTDWAGAPLRVGDRVAWFAGATPCLRCYSCRVLREPCENRVWPVPSDVPNAAGYREFATLSAQVPVFRVADNVLDEEVVALGCSLPTAISGMERVGAIETGQTVVIQGSGPVGLAATLLAGLSAARQVILVGAPAARLEIGRQFGASTTIDITTTTPEERREAILGLTDGRGADIVIEAAGHVSAFEEGLELLARNGRYLLSGLYSGTRTVPVNPVLINNRNIRIYGNLGSRPNAGYQALQFVAKHREHFPIGQLVTHRFPLNQTREAIESMANGTANKSVVLPGMEISA